MGEPAAETLQSALRIDWIDLAIILAYLVGIVALGLWAGMRRRQHAGDTYFLGGRTITWPIIGAALFASNISTVHMVSLAECGYKNGLLYGNFEWMAPFTLICLSLFFAPFYIRSGVTTLPDFLERRYNRACRDWLTFLSLVAAILVHIGFAFYTGAWVLHGMFGINLYLCIFVVAGLAGLYTIVGGLLAVMWTESIQTIILLTGAISITAIGLFSTEVGIGGWDALKEAVHPVNFSIIRPSSDPTGLSMWAVFLGYPVIGLWYWCCDQVIVQRVLAAKDENHARIGPLFTGFIKILPMFIFVLPGLICLGLISKGVHTDPLEDPKGTLTYLINHVLPPGMKGLMAAALLAAMMGSVSAALNSIATVFSYDVVRRWRPEISDRAMVLVGRVVTVAAMLVAVAWSPLVGRFDTIFQGLNDIICYLAPPITAVFLLGVFWRRTSAKAAIVVMLAEFVAGVVIFVIAWNKEYTGWSLHSMIAGFYMFLIACTALIVLSYLFPHHHTTESESLVWKSVFEPLRGKAWRGIGDYRLVAFALFAVMVFLYWTFAGDRSYYPVECRLTLADEKTPVAEAKVTLQCDDPRFNFSATTDDEGRCSYGTSSLAGGAPAGATYRVAVEPGEGGARIHSKYAVIETSGLTFTVEAKKNELRWKLDPPAGEVVARSTESSAVRARY